MKRLKKLLKSKTVRGAVAVVIVASCTRVVTVPGAAPAPAAAAPPAARDLEAGCDTVQQWITRNYRSGTVDTLWAELHVCPRQPPPDVARPAAPPPPAGNRTVAWGAA